MPVIASSIPRAKEDRIDESLSLSALPSAFSGVARNGWNPGSMSRLPQTYRDRCGRVSGSCCGSDPDLNPTFQCPQCEGPFQVPQEFLQQASDQQVVPTVQCPHCQASVEVAGKSTNIPSQSSQPKRRPGVPEVKQRDSSGKPEPDPDELFAPGFRRKTNQPAPVPKPAGASRTRARSAAKPDQSTDNPVEPSAGKDSELPETSTPISTSPPDEQTEVASDPVGQDKFKSLEEATETTAQQSVAQLLPSIDHLLPPKFQVDDPEQLAVAVTKTNHKILLPDGKGGVSRIDDRVVRIQHGQEKVTLLTLTPQQKARRRFIVNLVTILLAIACMALAFWILQ